MRPSDKCSALNGARLLEVTERSPAHKAGGYASFQHDSRPSLVFDKGVLNVENPFLISCDSGESASLSSVVGCCVSDTFSTATEFFVVFEGRISLRVSLRDEDFIGPEAASYRANTGEVVIVT
jgi:hypothetical protein